MSISKISFVTCVTISVLFLAAGFGIAGLRIWALALLIIVPAWLYARKYADTILPVICLVASVGLAVLGRLIGAPSLLMIASSGFSLAAWDLLLLDAALGTNSSGEQRRQYEIKHVQSLTLALGSGFLLAFLGRLLILQIPFALLVLFVTLAVFGMDRAVGYIKKRISVDKVWEEQKDRG